MQTIVMIGDCLEKLKELPDESVNTCVTSPPYWNLRDYGVSNQLGLEDTPEEFVDNLVKVFREVKRVLRNDGTLWLNLGDSYAGHKGNNRGKDVGGGQDRGKLLGFDNIKTKVPDGLKQKDLVGIPFRVAFALQQDGWYLRQDIIWHKPNPMPESVKDRCTKAHEYIFLLSKSPKYYFDSESIKEDAIYSPSTTKEVERPKGYYKGKYSEPEKANRVDGSFKAIRSKKNKRSVWSVSPKPFKDAHFATFPMKLIEPCILAGCPQGGTVLDIFGGSGTTGIVANSHDRDSILIELNKDYVNIMEKRFNDELGLFSKLKILN